MYLEVKDVNVYYDRAQLLDSVNLRVDKNEAVCIVGPNGAGKSTLLRTLAGLAGWERDALKGTRAGRIIIEGSVKFDGMEILNYSAPAIAKMGLMLCPERGRVFPRLTVLDNLKVGAFLCRDNKEIKNKLERVYQLFPRLKEREKQKAGTLSGGERIMLAISRSLMFDARLLMIDEPSTGLAPILKRDLFGRMGEIHGTGLTILLAEQDVKFAFSLTTRSYLMSKGHVIAEGTPADLLADEFFSKTYLGV